MYPVAGTVALAKAAGARIVIVNAEPTGFDEVADVVFREHDRRRAAGDRQYVTIRSVAKKPALWKRKDRERKTGHRSQILLAVHGVGDRIVQHLRAEVRLPQQRAVARIDACR